MLRRQFLSGALATAGLSLWSGAARAALTSPRVVFVFLRGGVDALSLIAPSGSGFSSLQAVRPTIAMTNPIAFGANLVVHPAMAPLLATGIVDKLNFVLHAGSTADNRSHFDQQYRIETGDENGATATGFLSRAAASMATRGASVTRAVTQSLRGGDPLVIEDPARVQAGFSNSPLKPGWTRAQRLAMFKVAAGESGNATIDALARKAETDGNTLASELSGVTLATLTASNGYVATSKFAQSLALAARLCTTSVDPRILTVNGEQFWDTHSQQRTNDPSSYRTMYKSIADLATNLAAFKSDLVARGIWNSTVVVVMSEFGRTVQENSAFGTDHGRGGVMLLMGGRVRRFSDAAYVGSRQWSVPAAPDSSSPLAVVHDYRLVMAEIMERHLAMPKATVASTFLNQASLGSYLNVLT